MSFEDIPEDYEPSYSCPQCELGEVALDLPSNKWLCDECDFCRSNAKQVMGDKE